MILKSYEISKLNLSENKFILLYGKNEGLKNQTKIKLLENKKITSKYEEAEIINTPDVFFESLISSSLFEKEKIIIITRVTDKIFKIISEIIEKKIEDLIIFLDSDNLEKKSKVRNLFEKSKKHVCIPFYPDTNETLAKLAYQAFKKANISLSSSNINLIVNKCNGDRKILFTELEKVTNYAKSGKKIDTAAIDKLTNLIENHSISELIDNCLAKNKNKTINILVENNFNSEDCIIITRVFINKLKKILNLSKEFQKNKNLDLTISTAKPPIFWKEKEITKKQILNWTPKKIKETLYKINDIEFLIKKNYDNSINLVTDFILNLISKKTNN
tara:strand:- start:74 stop:1066 length:993 start_codon:yes stop_codon:yes gene_type:complete